MTKYQITIEELFAGAEQIAVTGHTHPDGDCVGSCLALAAYLKKAADRQNRKVHVDVYLEMVPAEFMDLAGAADVHTEKDEKAHYDLLFVLDCGDAARPGLHAGLETQADRVVCIDHHYSNQGFGDAGYIDGDASSTCEVLFEMMAEELIDVDIARCLYTGIIHDTGVFHHNSTHRRTMEIAGILMEKGFDFGKVIDESFYQKTLCQNRLMGEALIRCFLVSGGKGILSLLPYAAFEAVGATSADTSGIIDQMRLTAGVKAAALLYEYPEKNLKLSLRATDPAVDVSQIAIALGGGGHRMAAGASLSGDPEEVLQTLTEKLECILESSM